MSTTYIKKNYQSKRGHQIKAFLIFFLASFFYLYEYILQVAPSVMAEPMMASFNVNAESFGIVSACYFYAYAPMQLPAGLLYDRYGPRRVMTYALLICALGTLLFAINDDILMACLGRFMIGMGSAFSFIGVLVLTSRWFSAAHFATMAGIAQLMSSIGASFGQMPLAELVSLTSWRISSFLLAIVGFILSLAIYLLIKDSPDHMKSKKPVRSIKSESKRFIIVCKKSCTWTVGAYAFFIWTPIVVFAALWGIPYLEVKYQVSVVTAASLCSMVWLGIGLGSPLWGFLSDRFMNRRLFLGICSLICFVAILYVLYMPRPPINTMYFILFMLGLGAGGQSLSFAVVKDNNAIENVGTASGFNNLAVLIGGAIFQPVVGFILHDQTSYTMVNGVPVYSLMAYQKALFIMPCCYFLSLLVVLFLLKESYPLIARREKEKKSADRRKSLSFPG